MPPKSPILDAFPSSSLPLLVQMPDGERRQVDVPSNSSIKDLKSSIAKLTSETLADPDSRNPDSLAGWDLGFGGSVLQDSATLNDYNIPEAYDHANGLLRTITESAHTDAGKKVEALDKAVAVVKGISRGERDMEKLIASVFDDDEEDTNEVVPQPSLSSIGRRGRSRVPALNFSNLPPVGPLARSPRSGRLTAPPTPIQLLRRLSTSRPDLYDPKAAERADVTAGGDLKRQSSWFTNALEIGGLEGPGGGLGGPGPSQSNAQPSAAEGSGELKRGSTWFKDVFNIFSGDNMQLPKKEENVDMDSEGDGDDIAANSEEDELDADSDDDKEVETKGDAMGKAEHRVEAEKAATKANAEKDKEGQNKQSSVAGGALDTQSTSETMNAAVKLGAQKPASASANTPAGTPASEMDKARSAAPSAAGQPNSTIASERPGTGGQPVENPALGGLTQEKPSGLPAAAREHKIGLHPENPEGIKIPKKRGRKRKHPHLTDEQRKAHRQAQNRESAKMSRIRRKHMTAEYERRVGTLEDENANLRDTVAALTDRLQILQNLLTISVHKSPAPAQALQRHLPGSQVTQSALSAANGSINPTAALNIQTGLNPQGMNGQMSLNPATSFPSSLHQPSSLNPQVGLNSQGTMSAQGRHLPKLNMTYKNF